MKKDLETAIKVAGKVVDHWLPMKIQYDHTPGAVVCIAVNGVPKYTNAFGYADLENDAVMKKDAQFRVASMSKMFTAVSILQLQESKQLQLDDNVSTYLDWFNGKQGKTDLSNVTIRQLLSHNAGLFRDGTTKHWLTDNFLTELSETISSKSIVFDNATSFKYSNHGFAVLGAIIEKVSGKSYVEYVTDNIIKKLTLKNTLADLPEQRPSRLAYGYSRYLPDQPEQVKEPDSMTNAYAPATGFISTAKDLVTFLASLHPDSKKAVLSRESRKEMMRVQNVTDDFEDFYGLGLDLHRDSGRLTYGHSGGFAGYTTNAISEPEDNVQVVALANTISGTAWTVSNNVMGLIYQLRSMKDIEYVHREPYSGTYRCRWGDLTVTSLGNKLVQFGAGAPNPANAWSALDPKRKNVFVNSDKSGFGYPGEEVRFSKVVDGKAQEMSNDGMTWKRIV